MMLWDRLFGRRQQASPANTEELFRAMDLLEPRQRERFLGFETMPQGSIDAPGLNVQLSDNSGPNLGEVQSDAARCVVPRAGFEPALPA
jgi:hypothetical protein